MWTNLQGLQPANQAKQEVGWTVLKSHSQSNTVCHEIHKKFILYSAEFGQVENRSKLWCVFIFSFLAQWFAVGPIALGESTCWNIHCALEVSHHHHLEISRRLSTSKSVMEVPSLENLALLDLLPLLRFPTACVFSVAFLSFPFCLSVLRICRMSSIVRPCGAPLCPTHFGARFPGFTLSL